MEARMQQLIDTKNWSKTPLGPRENWPEALHILIKTMLNSRFPMFLFWGPELISFYNDAFRPSLGSEGKHPHILGAPAHEAWSEIWDTIKPLLDQALHGEPVWHEDLLVPFYRNGRIEDIYWTFSYSAIHDASGKPNGVLVICNETTEKILYTKNLKESEDRFRNVVFQAPIGIVIFRGEDLIVEMASRTYLDIVDKKESELVGRPFFEVLPDLKPSVEHLLRDVLKTGVPFYGTEFKIVLNRYGITEDTYFNFVYYPLRNSNNFIDGIIVVATEVTENVRAKFKIQESEKKFRELVMNSPIPMTIFRGPDFIIETANEVMFRKIWRKKESEVTGRKLLDVFPELKDQKYPELLTTVYESGKVHNEKESVAYVQGDDELKKFILDYEYMPLFNTLNEVWGIMVTVNDITEKVEARRRAEENEEKLNIVINASELGTWEINLKTAEIHYSDRFLQILGYKEWVDLSYDQILKHVHPEDMAIREAALERAVKTGIVHFASRIVWNDGSIHWGEGKGKVFYDSEGNAERMLGTVRDITDEKRKKEVLERSEEKFRLLAETMPQFVWTASADGKLNYHNEVIRKFVGRSTQELDKQGLFSIVHPDDELITKLAWDRSIQTGQPFLLEHRFKRSDGTFHWHLSRAKPQKNSDGKIEMWVGTSTDIQEQKTFSEELELKVKERTGELAQKNADLERMNDELKTFAYVSSHDLQEPLRKIQTFTSRIRDKETLSEKGLDYFERIQKSAHQMQVLIHDLLAYSRTTEVDHVFARVNLGDIISEVKSDFHDALAERNGIIKTEKLCDLKIIPVQFKQVMHNLISNSLKFSKPGTPPLITIRAEPVAGTQLLDSKLNGQHKEYCRVSVADNGIGFDPRYKEKIFEVFQRLHGRDQYSGTGVGLAIVKRIIDNHHGFIEASSQPGEGARFDIYLPM